MIRLRFSCLLDAPSLPHVSVFSAETLTEPAQPQRQEVTLYLSTGYVCVTLLALSCYVPLFTTQMSFSVLLLRIHHISPLK